MSFVLRAAKHLIPCVRFTKKRKNEEDSAKDMRKLAVHMFFRNVLMTVSISVRFDFN